MKVFDQAMSKMNRALIGHNRFATQGTVTRRNAHPFEFDNIVGVHNGTLINKHKLADSNLFTVDSENLFHHIDKQGLDSFLDVGEGAWSLVWWDKEKEELKFLRNAERPMWMSESEDGQLISWASEEWMLKVAQEREDIKWNIPMSLSKNTLYSFKIGKDRVIEKPRTRRAIAKADEPKIVTTGGFHGRVREYPSRENFRHGQEVASGTNSSALSVVKNSQVIPLSSKRKVLSLKKLAPSLENSYEGRKTVLLEVLSKQQDSFGAKYFVCFDTINPRNTIRLYIKSTDTTDLEDKEIVADIGKRYAVEGEGLYYKVEHSTVRLAPRQLQIDALNAVIAEENVTEDIEYKELKDYIDKCNEEENGRYFIDGRGRTVSRKDWETEYSNGCGWCTTPVNPEDVNKFTMEGDIICPTCAADAEVEKYVNFRK